ncbi:MAG: hypothetical protein R2750_02950 [Bacteroidales bacterium]
MKKIFLYLMLLILGIQAKSQYLAAFNDYQNHFWAFEAGQFTQLEHLEIQEYQVGGILIAYKDNDSNLKVYQYGQVQSLIIGDPVVFEATDYLLGYSMYEQLNVYDNGKDINLSNECDGYVIQDSLIGWHNRISQNIQVYYNGKIFTLEDGLIYNPLEKFRLGDNIIAYVHSSTKNFNVFYLGKIITLDDFVEQMEFKAGRDIVAYHDIIDQTLKAFWKGTEYELETFPPKSFQVGDESMAWVDNLGHLKYFDGHEVVELSTYEPAFYEVVDRVIVFEEQGFFKTYCGGQVREIERYIPNIYIIDFNTIAYLDQTSFIKTFFGCESSTIFYDRVQQIDLIRDLIIFKKNINTVNIYFNGEIYEH